MSVQSEITRITGEVSDQEELIEQIAAVLETKAGGGVTAEPLSVTENGTYIAPTGRSYTPVTVNVPTAILENNKTVTPSTSQQIINPDSGYDGMKQVTVNAMPTGTAGTPTASKGAVSNHQVTVTPSVQNTTGYITGGTKDGTGVVVKASELVSGSETKTENGTYDVTNLAELVVNVSGGGGSTSISPKSDTWQHNQYVTLTLDVDAEGNLSIRQSSGGGTTTNLHICYPQGSSTTVTKIPNIPTTPGTYEFPFTAVWQGDQNDHTLEYTVVSGGGEVSVIPLSVTTNGTYTAPSGTAYSPVTVNVSGGMNVQCYHGMASSNATSYSSTGVKLTVAKTGTYKVSWMGCRSTYSGTSGSQLYINNSAYGSAQTSFTNTYGQSVTLTGVSLTAGQEIEVRARARGSTYYMMVGQLCIEQTA